MLLTPLGIFIALPKISEASFSLRTTLATDSSSPAIVTCSISTSPIAKLSRMPGFMAPSMITTKSQASVPSVVAFDLLLVAFQAFGKGFVAASGSSPYTINDFLRSGVAGKATPSGGDTRPIQLAGVTIAKAHFPISVTLVSLKIACDTFCVGEGSILTALAVVLDDSARASLSYAVSEKLLSNRASHLRPLWVLLTLIADTQSRIPQILG
jgi:hypothetical protein